MLIVLPPSEGKTAPETGPRLRQSALSFPTLRAPRSKTLSTLIELCDKHPDRAATVLGLGTTQREWIAQNARLRRSPCAPAAEVYTGVLYDALDYSTLGAAARTRASERLAISSALFGLLHPHDLIPAYRLSGDSRLPALSLKETWHDPLVALFAAHEGLIVDMRSGAYEALAPLPDSLAERSVVVSVIHPDGRTVSHHNKATKGIVARELVTISRAPRTPQSLADAVASAGFEVVLSTPKGRHRLSVIVDL